jgi:hypothetical protein
MRQPYFILKWIPEFYFIMVSVLWFYHSINIEHSNSVNFPAVILIILFHMQLFLNDLKFGKVLAGIVAIATIVLLVLLSQRIINSLKFDYDSQIFILGLGNLVIVNIIMATLMFRRYKRTEDSLPL